ncbi:hypothetical protein BEWA_053870 [Theileria equi strain WA]|uniref:Uncharacterized protein n=1 Tax=Theileria equi strain WA TaxID=1537102 RepID=L1LDB6_THEEQ|nr:hypothetical protein BEWA_053870 [Theileria equi strain WA]EKX73331.1 hypothetical protein BEWA_053870 [Theileria equi strain WA]|eukprot:XP_004832783.1 hypothetical protein BEWA_053870 [Theileria equi strain WA]
MYSEGSFYGIVPEYSAYYRIGELRDGEVILEDHLTNEERYVFVVTYANNMVYIRVLNVYRMDDGNLAKHMEEFVRGPNEHAYRAVVRVPIGVDLLVKNDTNFVRVSNMMDSITKFEVKEEYKLCITIGVVRYGDHIVDDNFEGVIKKYIILFESTRPVRLNIITSMSDMTRIKSSYILEGDDGPFILVSKTIESV